jgi:hypothetical protein
MWAIVVRAGPRVKLFGARASVPARLVLVRPGSRPPSVNYSSQEGVALAAPFGYRCSVALAIRSRVAPAPRHALSRRRIPSYGRYVRAERLGLVVLFVSMAGGASACAGLAGLTDFSDGPTVDASSPTKPKKDASVVPVEAGDDTGSGDDELESSTGDAGDDASDASDDALEGSTGDAGDDAGDGEVPDAESADAGEAGPVGVPEAGVDAGDGGGSPGSDAGDGGCTPVVHSNGVGQPYTDCTPLNTYGATEAALACAAAVGAAACAPNATLCVGGSTVECTTTGFCKCWGYSGANAGHVLSSIAGPLCACPAATDPAWH